MLSNISVDSTTGINSFPYYTRKVNCDYYIACCHLRVHPKLYNLITRDILPGTKISEKCFFESLSNIVTEMKGRNWSLLEKRDEIQEKIDSYHKSHSTLNVEDYYKFLQELGYIVPTPDEGETEVITTNVDVEIAAQPAPQLVVPVDNARYALNAANARWGSLLDALYGTDVIDSKDGCEIIKGDFNPKRGAAVFNFVHDFLDKHFPLTQEKKHKDVKSYIPGSYLTCKLIDGSTTTLEIPEKFAGYKKNGSVTTSILLKNNSLHIELIFDATTEIGSINAAGIHDVLVEAAVTAICDCEDSVATVDCEDKVRVYSNWLGLMKGNLTCTFMKGKEEVVRRLAVNKTGYTAPDGTTFNLHGRAVLLIRNVGMHMYTNCVTTLDGSSIPEGILDCMVSTLAAMHDLAKKGKGEIYNSKEGSIYIVKPKMHGPEEVAFNIELFSRVESSLGLPKNTLKIGVMDEERRTTVNLGACIKEARERLVFINTGFLDRTGDEIHTSMEAGSMIPKSGIKTAIWRVAYENWNVDHGLGVKLSGKGQIGKGMWAIPDQMKQMLATKAAHPKSGATTAWVPSPTAAVLHALHYHSVDVMHVQASMVEGGRGYSAINRETLFDILTPPLNLKSEISAEDVNHELRESAQSILGYVVRWVEQGVGCSKVPDLNNVGLMEDRATLRISAQLLANWLRHGVISKEKLIETFKEMAVIVDTQNSTDVNYRPMSSEFEKSNAFQASIDLCTQGCRLPNGYTEPILCEARFAEKELLSFAEGNN